MASQIINFQKLGHRQYINEYVADDETDVIKIDKTILIMGSSVFVISTGNVYMLDGNKNWRPI